MDQEEAERRREYARSLGCGIALAGLVIILAFLLVRQWVGGM